MWQWGGGGETGLFNKQTSCLLLNFETYEFDLVYTLTSTNINQSVPKFVKIYMTIRSCVSSIMG